jgi:ribosomal protein L16 Arg81 hydroxylase
MSRAPTVDIDALRSLLRPFDPDRFLADYWEKKALYIPGTPDKFAALGFSLGAFRAMAHDQRPPSTIAAQYYDANGRPDGFQTDPSQLDHLVAAGMTVCMGDLERFSAALAEMAQGLKVGLGVAGKVAFSCYLSPPGGGFGMHFDGEDVFAIQVEGEKSWRYSREPAVRDPLSDFSVGDDTELRAEFRRTHPWVDLVVPSEEELAESLLRPGDVLYLPPGSWHRARGVSRSLALSLSRSPYRMSDLVAELLPWRLHATAQWRRNVPSVPWQRMPPEGLPPEVAEFFAARLAELRELVQSLKPEDFAALWRRTLGEFTHDGAAPDELTAPEVAQHDTLEAPHPITFAVEGEDVYVFCLNRIVTFGRPALPFVRELAHHRRFVARAATAWSDGEPHTWDDMSSLLGELLVEGVLQRAA